MLLNICTQLHSDNVEAEIYVMLSIMNLSDPIRGYGFLVVLSGNIVATYTQPNSIISYILIILYPIILVLLPLYISMSIVVLGILVYNNILFFLHIKLISSLFNNLSWRDVSDNTDVYTLKSLLGDIHIYLHTSTLSWYICISYYYILSPLYSSSSINSFDFVVTK